MRTSANRGTAGPSAAADRGRGARARERERAQRIEREIDDLARSIQKFRIDAQRFFAGDLPSPPDEQRDRIQIRIRRLRSSNLQGAVVNFRLGSLEAQFNSHLDLFGRRLRQREVGAFRTRAAAQAPPPDPKKGVVIARRADARAVEALYRGLYPKVKGRQPKMDFCRAFAPTSTARRRRSATRPGVAPSSSGSPWKKAR